MNMDRDTRFNIQVNWAFKVMLKMDCGFRRYPKGGSKQQTSTLTGPFHAWVLLEFQDAKWSMGPT